MEYDKGGDENDNIQLNMDSLVHKDQCKSALTGLTAVQSVFIFF